MHVLMIASWYKTSRNPLLGTFFEEQARAMMRKGVKVTIFFPDIELTFRSRFQDGVKEQDFNDDGLPTYYLKCRSILPRAKALNYTYFRQSAYHKCLRILQKEGQPNLIHAHCVFNAGIVAEYLSEKLHIPYIITEHYSGLVTSGTTGSDFNRKIVETVFAGAAVAIAVSKSFRADLERKYKLTGSNLRVIPNMVDDLFFEKDPSAKVENMCFANAFVTVNKNHRLLLEAFKVISRTFPDYTLVIGGDGVALPGVKAYAEELQLGDRVVFAGSLSRREVKHYLDRCAMFLSTSQYETFGIALIEALACGKPVISTDSGGPREYITPENGVLVERHEKDDFSRAVMQVIRNYSHFDQRAISTQCKAYFSSEVVTTQILKIYRLYSIGE